MLPKIPKKLKRTEFYHRLALIIGDHIHSGKTAQCIGAFLWARRWYMVFQDTKSNLQFVIESPVNITWIEERKKT